MAVFTNPTSCGFAKVVLHLTRLNEPYFNEDNYPNEIMIDNPSALQKLDRYCSFFLQRKTDYEVDL